MDTRIKEFENIVNFSLQTKLQLIKINSERNVNFSYLKPLQLKSIKSALNQDTLAVLPTGYGKSLIFEILPYLTQNKALIVCPLNAIIEEQHEKLGHRAVVVDGKLAEKVRIGATDKETVAFVQGIYTYAIGHPEHFVKREICDILKNEKWENVGHVICDEAHCVVQWGHEFRPDYQKISKLRAIFPKSIMVALTATATVSMQREIARILQMQNEHLIVSNLDRPNIKIEVKRRLPITGKQYSAEESYQQVINSFISEFIETTDSFAKTIVYSKLKWCGFGYDAVYREASSRGVSHLMEKVSQYHAPSTEKMKSTVATDMSNTDGKIKFLFATEAYGMGTDSPNVRRVIHIGPPSCLETYVQEIGRGGRDGNPAVATLYYNMNDIGSNTLTKSEVREFCLSTACRRAFLCRYFGFEHVPQSSSYGHDCCDVCEQSCECDSCFANIIDTCAINSSLDIDKNEDGSNIKKLETLLLAYFNAENHSMGMPNPEIYTGLTPLLAESLANKCHEYKCGNDIKCAHKFLKDVYVQNIMTIMFNFQVQG